MTDHRATILRLARFTLLILVAWCVMTFTHECGHLIGGWCCGGRLKDADLWPWHLPYSIFDPDPMPQVTLWCGPILGVLVPLGAAVLLRREWAWFVAHFCVLANGSYLATAWYSGDQFLDTTKLLHHGAHPALIAIYCVLTIGFGYVGFRRSCQFYLAEHPRLTIEPTNDPNELEAEDEANRTNLTGPDEH